MSHNHYFVTNLFTGQVLEELKFVGATYSTKINAAGTFTGKVPATTDKPVRNIYKATTPGNRGLYVVRKGIPVWGGIIWDRSYQQSNASFEITALGFEVYFSHRVIWKKRSYTNVDIFELVRDIVNAIQVDFNPDANVRAGTSPYFTGTQNEYSSAGGRPLSANLNISLGGNQMGFTETNDEDFRGSELKLAADAINALSDNQHNFEWRIAPTFNTSTQVFGKALQLYQPAADASLATATFEFPGVISDYTWSDTMEGASTRYWETGAGDGPDKAIANWVNDSILNGSQTSIKHDYTNFPLYDEVDSSTHGSTKSTSKLQGYAQTSGQRSRPPLQDWSVTVNGAQNPDLSNYQTGDWAKFIIDDPKFGYKQGFARRITDMTVTVPEEEDGDESVALLLESTSDPAQEETFLSSSRKPGSGVGGVTPPPPPPPTGTYQDTYSSTY